MKYEAPTVRTVDSKSLLNELGPAQALIYFDEARDDNSGKSGSSSSS